MSPPHIAVVGSGAFARSICSSLTGCAGSGVDSQPRRRAPIRVTVLARSVGTADEIARLCRVRAAVSGARVAVAAHPLIDEERTLAELRPDVLVCCASAQSPYERTTAPSGWTRLIERTGFGFTLPLQAAVVARLARALTRVSPDTLLVNGCFPDAVNPLLAALDLPVHCGIGNVATVAACLQSTLDLPDQAALAVLGHHVHLTAPDDPAEEVRAWHAGRPIAGVTALLAADRALPRREINAIAGHTAARLVLDLVAGVEIRTSLPGPLGLPGGYPVRLTGRGIALNLPAELTTADAIAWNIRVGRRDGMVIEGGRIEYPEAVAETIAGYLPTMAAGWAATELDAMTRQLTALRHRLRLAPPVPVGPGS